MYATVLSYYFYFRKLYFYNLHDISVSLEKNNTKAINIYADFEKII